MKNISKTIIGAFALTGIALTSFGQNEVDALRYSFMGTPGTTRSLGMGGAFGALGADVSSFWNNPAGLGVYRRSSLEFGLNFNDRMSNTSFQGNSNSDEAFKTYLSHLGFVSSKESETNSKIRSSIGIGVGLLNNYNQSFSANGTSNTYTLMDVFASQANGVPQADLYDTYPFGAGLAYNAYLIDPYDTIQHTYIPADFADQTIQRKIIDRLGRSIETTFGGAVTYDDLFSIGMTIGIQSIYFKETGAYSEKFPNSTYISNYTFSENLVTYGNGVNIRLGGIYNVGKWLKVGASYQSRTNLSLEDSYSTQIRSLFKDGSSYNESSPELKSNYNVRVPAKTTLSVAFILGKSGVVSADYEYTDFSKIRMNSKGLSSDYSYDRENATIDAIYRGAHKVKMGMELRFLDVWRARMGAVYQTSPFVKGTSNDDPVITYTGGFGYRKGSFFADLAVMVQTMNETYWFYNPQLVDPVRIQNNMIATNVGIGFKF
ncbi:MAG: outer membrane protein transport protein [Flavobacteriales bacterium]